MRTPVDEVVAAAELVLGHGRDLLSACRRKSDAMVAVDTPEVAAWTRREAEATEAYRRVETVLREAVARFGESAGLVCADLTLGGVLARSGEPQRTRLAGLRERLAALARDLDRTNRLNRLLSAQSLHHLQVVLGAIAGGEALFRSYSRPGPSVSPPRPRSVLLDRIA
ncbi:MAG: flagellar protein FlgN [Planctomycetes bacterium]|nr:flagellar protein FlgN [Planctomycetota bacterium]